MVTWVWQLGFTQLCHKVSKNDFKVTEELFHFLNSGEVLTRICFEAELDFILIEKRQLIYSIPGKSNSDPKQILVNTSPELGNWESSSVTFLYTLWWRWVKTSCYRQVSMYVGGLNSRFQRDSARFQWGGPFKDCTPAPEGLPKPSQYLPKSRNLQILRRQCWHNLFHAAHNSLQMSSLLIWSTNLLLFCCCIVVLLQLLLLFCDCGCCFLF